jgi:membrane protein implicated in regulation of membrane protease activity
VSTLALVMLGALLLVIVVAVARVLSRRGSVPRGRPEMSQAMEEREAAMTTQAEVEDHDIDEMVEALDERRRRSGRPSVGDELADRVRRPEEP